jgi:hypothetical protein
VKNILNITILTALVTGTSLPAHALSISAIDSNPTTGTMLTNAWLGATSGISVVSPINYVGATNQAGTYTNFSLISANASKPNLALGNGIVLTSGTANIPNVNNSSSFGVSTGSGSSATINSITGLSSRDANSISFSFTVASGITSISTNFIYGSEEFPEFAGSSFADGFAFIVDGINYAKFADGSIVSLKTLTSNLNLLDNMDDSYGIEYDGITKSLTIDAILDTNLVEHTLEIVIADTGDGILDSGVFLSALSAGNITGDGGIKPTDPGTTVPVPAALPLLASVLGMFGLAKRRKDK